MIAGDVRVLLEVVDHLLVGILVVIEPLPRRDQLRHVHNRPAVARRAKAPAGVVVCYN